MWPREGKLKIVVSSINIYFTDRLIMNICYNFMDINKTIKNSLIYNEFIERA